MVLPNLTEGMGILAPRYLRDADTCAIINLNHLEPAVFPHPPCEDPDPCGDADLCEGTESYGRPSTDITGDQKRKINQPIITI